MNEVVRCSDVFIQKFVKCGAHDNVLKMEMGYVHKRYEWVQDSVTNRIRGKPMLTGTNLGRTVPR